MRSHEIIVKLLDYYDPSRAARRHPTAGCRENRLSLLSYARFHPHPGRLRTSVGWGWLRLFGWGTEAVNRGRL